MNNISTCLWFDDKAEEAAIFYTSLHPGSKIGTVSRYSEAGAQASGRKVGSAMVVPFSLQGQGFVGLNGGPMYKFSPAMSLYVWCKTDGEIETLWKNLSAGGSVIWELKKYPWAEKYGWCEDKFGISWQLMLSDEQKIAPAFLFVDKLFGKGEAAIQFYLSKFKNSKLESVHKDPGTNTILHAVFSLEGKEFVMMEGQGPHQHRITPAMSIVVNCQTQAEVDHYWDELSAGGSPGQCGWLTDKYGVSWQIVPSILGELMSNPDPSKAGKVMKAMLQMKKLDIEKLKQAAESA